MENFTNISKTRLNDLINNLPDVRDQVRDVLDKIPHRCVCGSIPRVTEWWSPRGRKVYRLLWDCTECGQEGSVRVPLSHVQKSERLHRLMDLRDHYRLYALRKEPDVDLYVLVVSMEFVGNKYGVVPPADWEWEATKHWFGVVASKMSTNLLKGIVGHTHPPDELTQCFVTELDRRVQSEAAGGVC